MTQNRNTLNKDERAKLKTILVVMTKYLQEMEDAKDSLKETAKDAATQFSLKPALINKMAKTLFKSNYRDLQEENEHFEFLYESILEGKRDDDEDNNNVVGIKASV